MEVNRVHEMDCLEGIERMKDAGVIPDLIITDPPYEFDSVEGGFDASHSKVMAEIKVIGTDKFDINKFIPAIIDLQGDRVNAYFFCNKKLVYDYLRIAKDRGLNYDILTLNKINPVPCKYSSYMPEIEYIIFMRSKGVYFNGDLPVRNYFKSYKISIGDGNNKHPNQKPMGLIDRFVKISSDKGHLVMDCFMGSGTTALSARSNGRSFIGFEINPKYVKLCEERLGQTLLSPELYV